MTDRNETILDLWAEGHEPVDISRTIKKRFGEYVDQSAIINLTNRARARGDERALKRRTINGKSRTPFNNANSPVRRKPSLEKHEVLAPPQEVNKGIPLLKTTNRYQCRFPLNADVKSLIVCGKATEGSEPYCKAHCDVAYTPARPRLKS